MLSPARIGPEPLHWLWLLAPGGCLVGPEEKPNTGCMKGWTLRMHLPGEQA